MFNKTKSAFTLAETLMTLAVIGVIAAMTMPGLQQHAQLQANVALAQKAYSTLSNVTRELKLENGPVRMWELDQEKVTELYKTKMNAIGTPEDSYDVTYLNKSAYQNANMFNEKTSFITADGMLFYVQSSTASCQGGDGKLWKGCIDWGVDTNGMKGPNQIGMDIFGFYVTNDGSVFPEGSVNGDATYVNQDCVKGTGTGWSCSTKIIQDKKITWK